MRRDRLRRLASVALAYAGLGVALILAVAPVLWTVLTSFKTEVDAIAYPPVFLGFVPTLDNYRQILRSATFYHSAQTSIVVTCAATLLAVTIAAPNAATAPHCSGSSARSLSLKNSIRRMRKRSSV